MATYNKFQAFILEMGKETHNLGTDVLKAVLTNTAPSATDTTVANITQIATGGGYTQMSAGAGGITLTGNSWTHSSGVAKLILTDSVFTATGTVGPFRYVVLVNETSPSDNLIGWYDRGASITLENGETFTIDFDGTNGVFTMT